MKKIFLIVLIGITYAFANIGKITAVKGEVYIIRDSQQIVATSGSILELKDQVQTKNKSKALVLFKDNTSITVGNNSLLSVNEFVMDLKTPSKSKTNFGFGKVIFRTITGRIGKINPKGFRIKTRSASIGIRGTIFEVAITDDKLAMDVQSGATWLLPDNQQIPTEVPEGSVLVFDDKTGALEVMIKAAFEKKKKAGKKKKGDSKADDSGEGESSDSPGSAPIDMGGIDDSVDSVEQSSNNSADDIATNTDRHTYTYETMCKAEGVVTCDHYANFDYGYAYKDGALNNVYRLRKVITDTGVIQTYIDDQQETTGSYTGNIAAIVDGSTLADGTINLTFNFNNSTFGGNLNIEEGGWNATFDGSLNNEAFSATLIGGYTNAGSITDVIKEDGIDVGSTLAGNYYGDAGESVGGFLNLKDDTGGSVSGVFGAHDGELAPIPSQPGP